MIRIRHDNNGISISGHAHYAEQGKDIVCAGVSALVQNLIQSIEELTVDEIQYSMQPGTVDIKFWCLSEQSKVLIDAFFIGVKLIAEEYPNNVELNFSEIPKG